MRRAGGRRRSCRRPRGQLFVTPADCAAVRATPAWLDGAPQPRHDAGCNRRPVDSGIDAGTRCAPSRAMPRRDPPRRARLGRDRARARVLAAQAGQIRLDRGEKQALANRRLPRRRAKRVDAALRHRPRRQQPMQAPFAQILGDQIIGKRTDARAGERHLMREQHTLHLQAPGGLNPDRSPLVAEHRIAEIGEPAVPDPVRAGQIVRMPRHRVPARILGRRDEHLIECAEHLHPEALLLGPSGFEREIDALAHQIDLVVVADDLELDLRMLMNEGRGDRA
ncbi:hypothetical protein DM47_3407 [Burkholderia mallei]|nr:hypothetical protein DM77_3400 [Burkholderia mallei]KOT20864.1 hypothetical protein DM47_3407 [Burkholderia mallei]